jgi:hypothetical protein
LECGEDRRFGFLGFSSSAFRLQKEKNAKAAILAALQNGPQMKGQAGGQRVREASAVGGGFLPADRVVE